MDTQGGQRLMALIERRSPRITLRSASYPQGRGELLAWDSAARGVAESDAFLFRGAGGYFVQCVYADDGVDQFIAPVDPTTARRLYACFRAKLADEESAFPAERDAAPLPAGPNEAPDGAPGRR